MTLALVLSTANVDARPIETKTTTTSSNQTTRITTKTYLSTLSLGLSAGAIKLFHPYPRFGFRGGWLFDDGIQKILRLESEEGRETASLISDFLQIGLVAAPFMETSALYASNLIDGHRAWERSMIDLQSIGVAMSILLATKTFVGRLRPKTPPCRGGDSDLTCASAPLRMSFVSGHTTAAFTGAGLLCAHQTDDRPAYPLEKWTCPAAIVLATGTGLLRIMSDNHYTTDVIGGAALGLLSGYALPRLLHYTRAIKCSEADNSYQCFQSRLPGRAELYAQLAAKTHKEQTVFLGGAKLNLEQEYRHLPQGTLAGVLRAEGELQSDLADKQTQTLILMGGMSYRELGMGWLANWSSQQEGNISTQNHEQGVALFYHYKYSTQKALRARVSWYAWSPNAAAYAFSLEARLGQWWAVKSEFKSETPGLESGQYLLNFGIGTYLPWNED